ncbi:MAG: 1-deoxy-D-xylulose-5-phosphate synthase [Ruminococcaceae bacterium]|nr:1-deoxy-D-xylulose-5-phosphate synthase [Oscillospiraceae bacterium]
MLIEDISSPEFIKGMSNGELRELAYQIRKFLIKSVSKTGGHLASNLGVVELTLAMHSVFDFKKDRIIWDVGHQSYVHKLLTGRAGEFSTLRQFGGISGFPKTSESEYDAFNTGHSSTSASAALGLAHARDLSGENYNVVSVFGDGALTGGMIFEALNNAGHSDSKVIFILNDNEMSISQNVGALSKYLQQLRYKPEYYKSKDAIVELLSKLPVGADVATSTAKKAKNAFRKKVLPNTLFDNLGLKYVGPVDGHNIEDLKSVLERAKLSEKSYFIHIHTKKGKGYAPAEENPQLYHGISSGSGGNSTDYSKVFGDALLKLAEENEKIVAITGAMPLGTGLLDFSTKFPKRYFDVGICEEHAVTMAAGLAIGGFIPVVPIYSTFLQRAYDQILHDVCLQNLHVVLCADRAGIVGQDGETHQGMFDIAYLSHMPNMTILSPSSFSELEEMMDYAVNKHNGPITIRYPRGNTQYISKYKFEPYKIRVEKEGSDLLIISSGRMMKTASEVAEKLGATLLNMPTVFPFDEASLLDIARGKKLIVTIEDSVKTGGMGQIIGNVLLEHGIASPYLPCAFPNEPITHGTCAQLDKLYKMDTDSIIQRIEDKLNG